jgi:hypothetical protein
MLRTNDGFTMKPTHPNRIPRFAIVTCLVGLLGLTDFDAKADDRAADLFDRGVAQMNAGRYEEACPAIEESYQLDPRAGTLFTLAECERMRGRIATAVEKYGEYLAWVARMPSDQQEKHGERAELARKQKAILGPQVPELTLVLPPSAPPGILVKCDDRAVAMTGTSVTIMLDPGAHSIVTQAPDAVKFENQFSIQQGEKRQLLIEAALTRTTSNSRLEPANTMVHDHQTTFTVGTAWMMARIPIGGTWNYEHMLGWFGVGHDLLSQRSPAQIKFEGLAGFISLIGTEGYTGNSVDDTASILYHTYGGGIGVGLCARWKNPYNSNWIAGPEFCARAFGLYVAGEGHISGRNRNDLSGLGFLPHLSASLFAFNLPGIIITPMEILEYGLSWNAKSFSPDPWLAFGGGLSAVRTFDSTNEISNSPGNHSISRWRFETYGHAGFANAHIGKDVSLFAGNGDKVDFQWNINRFGLGAGAMFNLLGSDRALQLRLGFAGGYTLLVNRYGGFAAHGAELGPRSCIGAKRILAYKYGVLGPEICAEFMMLLVGGDSGGGYRPIGFRSPFGVSLGAQLFPVGVVLEDSEGAFTVAPYILLESAIVPSGQYEHIVLDGMSTGSINVAWQTISAGMRATLELSE